ncbi:MAG TPA: hypothetical protein VK308_03645, partial [Pyrinomonadaceae bacterium]|nr:hypothetical protein [Pyrinomonadaceae bacterium]
FGNERQNARKDSKSISQKQTIFNLLNVKSRRGKKGCGVGVGVDCSTSAVTQLNTRNKRQ